MIVRSCCCNESTDSVLAECTVISEGVLSLPVVVLGSAVAEAVRIIRLTDLKTTCAEALVEALISVESITAVELESLHDVVDLETCS